MNTPLSGQKLYQRFADLYRLWLRTAGSATPDYNYGDNEDADRELRKLLEEHPDVASTIDEMHLETPLHLVAKGVMIEPPSERYLEWHRKMHPGQPDPEDPPQAIMIAGMRVGDDRLALLRLILAKGADVAARNERGETPLFAAVKRVPDLDRSLTGDLNDLDMYLKRVSIWMCHQQNKIIQVLLQRGSDPNTHDFWGSAPIHTAASRGQIELVQMLVSAGADIGAKTQEGETAKDLANHMGWGSLYERCYPTKG